MSEIEEKFNHVAVMAAIQSQLKVPKGRSGQHYKYRSVDDITAKLKPILAQYGAALKMEDTIRDIAGRPYIISDVNIIFPNGKAFGSSAVAEIPPKLGSMSAPQICGAASTYARKTALCGVLAIDDSPDPDGMPGGVYGGAPAAANGEADPAGNAKITHWLEASKRSIAGFNEWLATNWPDYPVLGQLSGEQVKAICGALKIS